MASGGITLRLGTMALAPTIASAPTITSCSTTEPLPTRARSSIVQPSRCTLWPIVQLLPIVVGWFHVVWTIVPSCTDVRSPT